MSSASKPFLSKESGFTFVGVILIIIALAIFTAALYIAVPPSLSAEYTQTTFQKSDLLVKALKKYKLDNNGAAPSQLSDLVTTTGTPCTIDTNPSSSTYKQLKGWCGPYLDQPIAATPDSYQTDGWGVLFEFDGVTLRSCGPDRTCGNSDDLTFTKF